MEFYGHKILVRTLRDLRHYLTPTLTLTPHPKPIQNPQTLY